jgi:hypothetical protein
MRRHERNETRFLSGQHTGETSRVTERAETHLSHQFPLFPPQPAGRRGGCVKIRLGNGYLFSIAPRSGEDIENPSSMFEVAVFDYDGDYDRVALDFKEDTYGFIPALEVRDLLFKLAALPRKVKKAV